MTRIQRAALVVLGLAVTVLGALPPAHATYADSAAAPAMAVTSIDVAAPGNLSTTGTRCTSTYNRWTGTSTALNARISWTASRSRGVTGYAVTAVFSDGTRYPVAQVDASTTSLDGDYDGSYATRNIRVTVTTLTSYGWAKESAPSGVITC